MIANSQLTGLFRYYEGGVSSVYFWDLDDGFAGVVLLKKCGFPKDGYGLKIKAHL